MPGGRKPSKEDLIPTIAKILDEWQGTAYDDLPPGWGGYLDTKLRPKLAMLPVDLLYVIHEALVNLQKEV